MSVCTANLSAIVSEPSCSDDDSAEPPPRPPSSTINTTSHQTLNGIKQRLLSPHKYFIHSLHSLIDRKRLHQQQIIRSVLPVSQCACLCMCEKEIKLTTPFHFPVSVSVHSSAVELVIFWPCFPPESILQEKIRTLWLCARCLLTIRLIEQMELPASSKKIHLALTQLWLVYY